MNEPTKLSPDQARLNAVIAQRNAALNAVAEHEALVVVLGQERDEAIRKLEEVTKERDELMTKPKEPEHGSPA